MQKIDINAALQAHPEFLNEKIDDHDKAIYAKGWNDCNKEYYNAISELPVASIDCTDLSMRLRRAFEADELTNHRLLLESADAIEELLKRPEIPETGIGDLSDGYHTFNGLYYQRMILFAALVRAYKDRAWKSYRHEDGELCFGGGWFIVGIDTPEGSYTYHYENKDFDKFDCVELPQGKHWDGHTEEDVIRLLSLPAPPKGDSPNPA